MSSFRWGMIACPAQRNSQVTGREAETPPVFIPLKQCFAYCFAHWRSPGVCIQPSSFWSITLKCLDADQSTIPNMKGDILSFHMMHRSMICSKRLQRNSIRISIEESYLVCIFIFLPVDLSRDLWSSVNSIHVYSFRIWADSEMNIKVPLILVVVDQEK